MIDQFNNYCGNPFCRNSRDLDILLLQLCGSIQSGDEFVGRILHRFRVFNTLFCREGQSKGSAQLYDDRSADTTSLLLISAMKLLSAVLVEILPPGTTDASERLGPIFRRELIQCLAAGPATHSALQECAAKVPGHKNVPTSLVSAIITQISDSREAIGAEPPKRILKVECWKEYDPCFIRLDAKQHQQAFESRPQVL